MTVGSERVSMTGCILNAVRRLRRATAREVSDEIGVDASKVGAILRQKFDAGLLDRDKPFGQSIRYWVATEKREPEIAKAYAGPIARAECRSLDPATTKVDPPKNGKGNPPAPLKTGQITAYIAERPGCTAQAIACHFGRVSVRAQLAELTRRGSIRRKRDENGAFHYTLGTPQQDEADGNQEKQPVSEPGSARHGAHDTGEPEPIKFADNGNDIESGLKRDRILEMLEDDLAPQPAEDIEIGLACLDRLCVILSEDVSVEIRKVADYARECLA